MVKNYLKIAWRNLIRNRASSIINIGGLAVGMAVAMLIGLWIYDELSFNRYHENYDRIAQITQKEKFLGTVKVGEHMPYPLINEFKANYAGNFKHVIAATQTENNFLSVGENKIMKVGQYIDADAPEMLTLKMLKGTWAALRDRHSILLSASVAKQLFGDADPMDKTIQMSGTWDPANTTSNVKVSGVYEDLPLNTKFSETQFFLPWDLYAANDSRLSTMGWDNHRFLIYCEIGRNTSFERVAANIKSSELKVISHMDNMKQELASSPEILINPMSKWHLYSNFKDGVLDNSPAQFVLMVGIIGCFVLLLACINFMNLSTARSEKRAMEVGIRKAIGSARKQLIAQFFIESFLVVILAFAISIVLAVLTLPVLNNLAAKQLSISFINPLFWLVSIGFILFTGLLAGIYPALYLSSFQPVKVLKGVFKTGRLSAVPRKALIVVQFTVSIVLIICTIIVHNQLILGKTRPVGYSRDGLVVVHMKSIDFQGKYDILRNELKNTGVVTEMAESESPVTGISSRNGGFTWQGKDPDIDENFGTLTVTPEYGKTIGWQFLDGRDFSREFASDSAGFVINEAAAKFMGFKHPIGEKVHWKSKWNHTDDDFQIIGVIKDMVMTSPFEAAQPVIFRIGGNPNWIFIRINPRISASDALPKIASVFKQIIPSVPFEYNFVDEEYAKKFTAEEHIGKLITFFASLAILISCLGLFGMASYMAEQRTKEIGVRKVLGATVFTIWRLLTKDFVGLVTISLLISTPIAFYAMHKWLQNYQLRAEIAWWIFIAAGLGAITITLLTVSYQSLKAALANPVKSLKTE
jgi:ABC-type antimicrobial peptide transport system permease subunit